MMTSEPSSPGIPAVGVDSDQPSVYVIETTAVGPQGSLPFDDEFLRSAPSGDIFGLSQSAGMGWNPTTSTPT